MLQALSEFRWIDLIDILIVAFVVYRLILLVKGTRAERMLWGLAVIVLVYFVSQFYSDNSNSGFSEGHKAGSGAGGQDLVLQQGAGS